MVDLLRKSSFLLFNKLQFCTMTPKKRQTAKAVCFFLSLLLDFATNTAPRSGRGKGACALMSEQSERVVRFKTGRRSRQKTRQSHSGFFGGALVIIFYPSIFARSSAYMLFECLRKIECILITANFSNCVDLKIGLLK